MPAPATTTLRARGLPLASAEVQRDRLRRLPVHADFGAALASAGLFPLRPTRIEVFQINVGKLCNQTCRHCHVDAGPDRRELMSRETMELCLAALAKTDIPTVDITGGAPELHPELRWLVVELRKLGRHVIDRCNLTVLETPAHQGLPTFFAEHGVEVVASLPHYRALHTDAQRGDGVYEKSIRALRRLNASGYGSGDPRRRLVLVTNPAGAFLPGSQVSLEREWKRELERLHGVRFDALYALANMPIARFLEWLEGSGNLDSYMSMLVRKFNPGAASSVMCRTTLSVGWDGTLHDCDFNQMLEMGLEPGSPLHVRDFDVRALTGRRIEVGAHCFGCTAGRGSSCAGAVV